MALDIKTAQEVYDELKAQAQTDCPKMKNYNQGSVWRSLLWLFARVLAALYAAIETALNLLFFDTYTGDDDLGNATSATYLERKCALLDVDRKQSSRTTGVVVFSRTSTTGAASVALGTIVATQTDGAGKVYTYRTTEAITLEDGEATGEAAIEALSVGAAFNVGAGAIDRILSDVPGIDAVTNEEDWITSEGTDTEINRALAGRAPLKWQQLGYGPGLYEGLALEIAGVVDVFVDDNDPRGPGTVNVIIQAATGSPSQALIDATQAHIAACKVGTDDVLVSGPVEVEISTLAITVTKHPHDGDAAKVKTAAEAAALTMFNPSDNPRAFGLGDDFRLLHVESEMLNHVDYVIDAQVTAPSANQTIGSGEIAAADAITVTVITAAGE